MDSQQESQALEQTKQPEPMTPISVPVLKCGFQDDEEPREVRNYDNTTIEELIEESNTPIDLFENTRSFNPRKQRSCHRRTEPVSDEHRKQESSKNSREYTKRNRNEIRTCQGLLADMEAKLARFQILIADLKVDAQVKKVLAAVSDFEQILKTHSNVGSDVRAFLKVADPGTFLKEYREKGDLAESLVFRTGIVSYEETRAKLVAELEALSGEKNKAHSPKDKTNHASTKSRLKQRVIRADLKVKCYNCWQSIETMRLQGAALKKCSDELKQKVWDNVLGVYNGVFQLSKEANQDHLAVAKVYDIRQFFAPYSEGGAVINQFVPPNRDVVKTVVPTPLQIVTPPPQTVAPPPQIVAPPTVLKGIPLKRAATISLQSTPSPTNTLTLPISSTTTTPIEEETINLVTPPIASSITSPPIVLTNVDGVATQLVPAGGLREPSPKRKISLEPVESKKQKLDPEVVSEVLMHTPEQPTIPLDPIMLMSQLVQLPTTSANNSMMFPLINMLPPGLQPYMPFSPQLISAIEQQQTIQRLFASAFSNLGLSK